VPEVFAEGQGGLLDVSIHPRFAETGLVYLTYAAGTAERNRTTVARARLDGARLVDLRVLFEVSPAKREGQHFGSRILWLPDGTLLVSIGDGGNPPLEIEGILTRDHAQRLDTQLGSVIRLKDDGSVPHDNPFVGQKHAAPELWAYGVRNIQGMALDPDGKVWANEHGPRGGDELNLLQRAPRNQQPVAQSIESPRAGIFGEGEEPKRSCTGRTTSFGDNALVGKTKRGGVMDCATGC